MSLIYDTEYYLGHLLCLLHQLQAEKLRHLAAGASHSGSQQKAKALLPCGQKQLIFAIFNNGCDLVG